MLWARRATSGLLLLLLLLLPLALPCPAVSPLTVTQWPWTQGLGSLLTLGLQHRRGPGCSGVSCLHQHILSAIFSSRAADGFLGRTARSTL